MNIRIEEEPKRRRRHRWRTLIDATFAILAARFGILTVMLFATLLVSESIYRHLLHPTGPVKIGGTGTLVGLGLLVCAFGIVGAAWARYQKQVLLLADRRSCMTLTDEYLEREVPGLWQQRLQWSILTEFKERKSSFQLKFAEDFFWLRKSDLKTEAAIAEVRAFLTARAPKAPPVAGAIPAG